MPQDMAGSGPILPDQMVCRRIWPDTANPVPPIRCRQPGMAGRRNRTDRAGDGCFLPDQSGKSWRYLFAARAGWHWLALAGSIPAATGRAPYPPGSGRGAPNGRCRGGCRGGPAPRFSSEAPRAPPTPHPCPRVGRSRLAGRRGCPVLSGSGRQQPFPARYILRNLYIDRAPPLRRCSPSSHPLPWPPAPSCPSALAGKRRGWGTPGE